MCGRLCGDVVGRKGFLKNIGGVVGRAVLDVVDVPRTHRLAHAALHHRVNAARIVEVARLACHHQHGIHARQRHHLHLAGELAALLAAERLVQCAGKILGRPVGNGEERIGLAGQRVDVEGAHQFHQRVALRRLAGDHQRVGAGHGDHARAPLGVGLQHLGQVLGRGVAQRHHHAAGRASGTGHPAGRRRRQHAIHPGVDNQSGPVLSQQRLQYRHQLALGKRGDGAQRGRAVHGGVDGVVHVQRVAQDLRHHLAYVGVGEIQRHAARAAAAARAAGRDDDAGPVADGNLWQAWAAGDAAVDPRRRLAGDRTQGRQGRQQTRLGLLRAPGQRRAGDQPSGQTARSGRRCGFAAVRWRHHSLRGGIVVPRKIGGTTGRCTTSSLSPGSGCITRGCTWG